MHEESFGIIPLREGKGWEVLLIRQRNGDFWGFPKGHAEKGEAKKKIAERELREEVGLEVLEYLPIDPLITRYTYTLGDRSVEKTVEFYLAKVSTVVTIDEAEVIEARWVPLAEVHRLISYTEGKALAQQIQEELS